MNPGDFEYGIKKDIRNNPIVREIDQARQRQLWRMATGGLVLLLVLLFSAYQHFQLIDQAYRMEKLQKELLAEEEANRHLKLELETRRAPAWIERVAREQLKMVEPGPDEAIVIERVVPSEPPAASVVASR
jgi:cell division protein FtsL